MNILWTWNNFLHEQLENLSYNTAVLLTVLTNFSNLESARDPHTATVSLSRWVVICEQLSRALAMREYKLVVMGSDPCGKSGWVC